MTKNRFVLIAVAGIFGILAWLSITVGEQYTITLTVPVTIGEIPDGLAIATPVPRTLHLRYRGDGWRLILLQFAIPAEIRIPYSILRKSAPPPGTDSASNARLAGAADLRLMTQTDVAEFAPSRAGVALIGVSPDSALISLDLYEERQIPVLPDILPSFREGYGQVGGVTVAPESIIVGGARSVIRNIPAWHTDHATFQDLRAPLEADVPIRADSEIPLSFSVSTVHVSLNVQPFAEKLMSGVPVEAFGIPPIREIIFIPPRIDLVARGGIKQLSSLSTADFQARVMYETLLEDTTGSVAPVITGPPGIQIVNRKPERLQYVIRKRL